MCIACVEYVKDKLTVNELKAALRETTANDPAHFIKVERILRDTSGNPDETKKSLQKLAADQAKSGS